jgi:hypothetical protein
MLLLNSLVWDLALLLYGQSIFKQQHTLARSWGCWFRNDRILKPIGFRFELAPTLLVDLYDDTVRILVFCDGGLYDLTTDFILTWSQRIALFRSHSFSWEGSKGRVSMGIRTWVFGYRFIWPRPQFGWFLRRWKKGSGLICKKWHCKFIIVKNIATPIKPFRMNDKNHQIRHKLLNSGKSSITFNTQGSCSVYAFLLNQLFWSQIHLSPRCCRYRVIYLIWEFTETLWHIF